MQKVFKKVLCGSFVGPPPGPPLESQSPTNRRNCSKKHVEKHCAQSAAQEVSRDSLQPSKSCSLCTSPLCPHFHPYLQNNRKLRPMGNPLGPLWDPFGWSIGPILADKETVESLIAQMVCESCGGVQPAGSEVPSGRSHRQDLEE